jgi:S1-C subfamily serine protease
MSIRSWPGVTIAISAIGVALAFAYLTFFKPFPNLSLEHLSSPHVKITRADGGHGSGTHLGNGYILTADHVVANATNIMVIAVGGKTYKAEIVSESKSTDTAIIRVIEPHEIGIAYTQCRDPALGEIVFATGNPHGLLNVKTRGFIARKVEPTWILDFAIIIDLTVAPGMSGGGVVDIRGFLVAVVSATITDAPLTLAIPASTFCPILKKAGVL